MTIQQETAKIFCLIVKCPEYLCVQPCLLSFQQKVENCKFKRKEEERR